MPIRPSLTETPSLSTWRETLNQLLHEWRTFPEPDDIHGQLSKAYHLTTLEALERGLGQDDEATRQFLTAFLAEHWQRIQGTDWDYTSQPEAPLTQLLCQAANWLGSGETSPITLLMPRVEIDSSKNGYPDLSDLPLQDVLRTYILGESAQYLVPVQALPEFVDCALSREPLDNPYYNVFNEAHTESMATINAQEYARLIRHSPLTQAVYDTKERCIELEKQDSSLLAHLKTLYRNLRFNDAHGGIGQQERAGEGAYLAVVQFYEFFDQLPDDKKNRIPASLLQEVDTLKAVTNQVGSIDSCIGLRREAIERTMQGHDELLTSIGLGETRQQQLKAHVNEAHERARIELSTALESKCYRGKDSSGFTREFLSWLDIRFTIHSMDDVNILMRCTAQEIQVLLNHDRELQCALISQLQALETLALFCMTHEHSKLAAILKQLASQEHGVLSSVDNLKHLFSVLNQDQLRVVVESIKDNNPLIQNTRALSLILHYLAPEQRTVVFGTIQSNLSRLVNNAFDLNQILKNLTPEQRAIVFGVIQGNLSRLVNRAVDLNHTLQHLTSEQRDIVFEAIQDSLSRLIQNTVDLNLALQYLAPEQCAVVPVAIQSNFARIINSVYDLNRVLQGLTPERGLTPEQCTVTIKAISGNFRHIIHSPYDLNQLLQHLAPEQCTAVLEATINTVGNLIKNANDLNKVFQNMSLEQCLATYQALRNVIKNSHLAQLNLGDEKRRRIHQCWFNHSLEQMQQLQLLPEPGNEQETPVTALKEELERAANQFFSEARTSESHAAFTAQCQKAINAARSHLRGDGWGDFFQKLLLTIMSFGFAPPVLAVRSYMTKGTFNFTLFPNPLEEKADELLKTISDRLKP